MMSSNCGINARENRTMPTRIKGLPGLMLRRSEASRHLLAEWGLSYTVNTLAVRASQQQGPPYHLIGNRALYPLEALDAWAQSRLSPLLNTSQDVAAMPQPKRRAQIPEQVEA
jgi:hypothetical protein